MYIPHVSNRTIYQLAVLCQIVFLMLKEKKSYDLIHISADIYKNA
jgi:hypothetical protein